MTNRAFNFSRPFLSLFPVGTCSIAYPSGGAPPDGYAIEHVPTGKRDKKGLEKLKARLVIDNKPGKFDVIDQPRFKVIEFAFTRAREGRGIRWLSKEIDRQGWRSRYRPEPISPA